jgi:hypothetical protein
MGGNGDEVADSLLEVARLLERTGSDPKTVTAAYLEAWDNHPARAEALVDLARHARNHQRFSIAWMAAQQARRIAQPLEVVWVDQEAYTWRRHDELAVSSYWVGDFEATAAICRELLDAGELPESERARVEENLRYAQAHLASSTMIGSSVADAANPVVAGASDPEPAAPESVETSDSPEPLDDHRPDDEIPDDEDFEEAIRLLPPQAWQAPEVWPSANSVSAEVTTPSVVAVPLLDHMIASLDQHAQLVPAQPPGPTGSTDSTTDSLWSRGPEGAVVNPPRIRLRTERRTEAE